MAHSPEDVTSMLVQWSEGDRGALDRLMPVIYDELHRIAERYFRREQVLVVDAGRGIDEMHRSDLIEEERALIGNFEQPFLRGHRAGE